MPRTFIAAKIHGLRVTDKSLHYTGSQSIPADLMKAAGIVPYEQVHVVNKHNGHRWITYAIPSEGHEVRLNGAAARLGEIGDELLLFTYRIEESYSGAAVVFITPDNEIDRVERYA